MSINKGYSMSLLSNHQTLDAHEKGSEQYKDALRSPSAQRSLVDSQKLTQNSAAEGDFYNLNSFYTVLNKTDVSCCSRKRPDEFLRDLLFKLLKYCKNFLNNFNGSSDTTKANLTIDSSTEKNEQFIDLNTAQLMYQSAEFKSILNESQELQHLNLYFLKTDNQKLSFFINLYNLLCIHSHFYLASTRCLATNKEANIPADSDNGPARSANCAFTFNLFHNRTEKLLFQQRMCYKVGQMGLVSLYDLKHLILMPRFLNNPKDLIQTEPNTMNLNPTGFAETTTTPKSKSKKIHIRKVSSNSSKNQTTESNDIKQLKSRITNPEPAPLYKYAFFKLDLVAEPLWLPFLPSEKAVCDYRIRFALNNCTESDPPISVYNSDELLDDQLEMQMNLFLNDSIYVDLCEDALYLPNFLISQFPLFLPSTSGHKNAPLNNAILDPEITLDKLPAFQSDLENLIRFLIEHVSEELSNNLKGLLELDQIEGFGGGENLDEFGRRILSFPIELLPKSDKFSLVIDYDYKINKSKNKFFTTSFTNSFSGSWYRKRVQSIIQANEAEKKAKNGRVFKASQFNNDENDDTIEQSVRTDSILSEVSDIATAECCLPIRTKNLNKDCLDYIHQNSPLISNSLSFLFDTAKRNEFFKLLTNECYQQSPKKYLGRVDSNVSLSSSTSSGQNFLINDLDSSYNNSLSRFIQLYVPLKHMKHLGMEKKLNMITQFLLTNNRTEESKIELIIDLANYYAEKQEWKLVLQLLDNCTQDNEELNDYEFYKKSGKARGSSNESFLNPLATTDYLDTNNNNKIFSQQNSSVRFSQKDLYNLYDHACICQAYQEAKTNEKSFVNLFKMKNFLRQIRAIFGLMHLWPIDCCLELVDYCLTKSKMYECSNGTSSLSNSTSQLREELDEYSDRYTSLVNILEKKKQELIAYKELTICARKTLEKYYEHQQIQDAAGFYDEKQMNSATNEISLNTSSLSSIAEASNSGDLVKLSKTKKVCQKCLTWQYAKHQLESPSTRDDEETNDLIMDLFLLNDQFNSAKYLIRKLKLGRKLQFKLDFGHLKHKLLNLNASTMIVIDFDAILTECIAFASMNKNVDENEENYDYVYDICYKLLNELKTLNELNNRVLISLSEYLLLKYEELLTDKQKEELKTIELTASIFKILVKDVTISFETYKRHHSSPLLIIEQLLMNSHIDLCTKAIQMCREAKPTDSTLHNKINKILTKYARKALEFKVYKTTISNDLLTSNRHEVNTRRSPQTVATNLGPRKKITSAIAIASSPGNSSNLSSSFKNLQKLASHSYNNSSFSYNTPPNSTFYSGNIHLSGGSGGQASKFVMPEFPPAKEDWVKDENVNECMVCETKRFSLINRRHHCRRCGRVVCSNCSQKVTKIENIPRRTCEDCFKQLELEKFHENRAQEEPSSSELYPFSTGLIKASKLSLKPNISSVTLASDMNSSDNSQNMLSDEVFSNWELIGENENDTSQKRDELVRNAFKYQQAPSTSLCLSILDLHDQSLECGKDLLTMCDDLSNYLQTANYQVEDFALIINMMKHLLHNAKVKLLQNSSTSIISLCDTYLSLIDVLEQLLLANCSKIPSLYELRNTESCRRIRNRILEEERHELAMNLSTKCGLDTQTVWASWGLIELRRGNYKDARTKFSKCLKPVLDKNSSIGQFQILNDLIGYLENASPIKIQGPQTLLAPLRSVEALLAEPKLYSSSENMMDDIQMTESIYYLETYGNHALIISFYQRHGLISKALQYVIDCKCSSDIFVESLLAPSLRTGEFYKLIDLMLGYERMQNKLYSYYGSIGKYLERNSFINTLYDFQLLMKDYVRASMSCICFFGKMGKNYMELYGNIEYLRKARSHLEQYLENYSAKQYISNAQQQQLTWRNKPEQHSLIKQISTQEIDNLLKAIDLQIEVTKFINNCLSEKKMENGISHHCPTLFGSNDTKINLCCLILLSGKSIQEGFGFVIRIIQCFNLKSTLVYSQIASDLAKQYNFKEINNLLKCINESGYREEVNSSYDECISTCIRVFAAATNSSKSSDANANSNQLYNKEIEELIKLIKDDENKINAYILNGRLRSAYLIAIKIERVDIVTHISNIAERVGQNLIKDICNKWLEKKNTQ